MASLMVDYKDSLYDSDEQRGVGYSADTLTSLREEISSFKANNDRII